MIRPIKRDPIFLAQPSSEATILDLPTAADLADTLSAHSGECVGMAANMIGVSKRIIVFDDNGKIRTMLNPEIISRKGEYSAEEGCLSLSGTRETKRFRTIRVKYRDTSFQSHEESFTGWTAQIIQHEIDHCNGILI